jgi:hypothetical protein
VGLALPRDPLGQLADMSDDEIVVSFTSQCDINFYAASGSIAHSSLTNHRIIVQANEPSP